MEKEKLSKEDQEWLEQAKKELNEMERKAQAAQNKKTKRKAGR